MTLVMVPRARRQCAAPLRCDRRSGGDGHCAPVRGTVDTLTVTAGGKPVERAQPDNAAAASEEQRVTEKDNDQISDEVTVETTSVFRADFLE